jgi:hypothetical protein
LFPFTAKVLGMGGVRRGRELGCSSRLQHKNTLTQNSELQRAKQLCAKRILNGMLCNPFLAISNNPANWEAETI